MRTRSLKRGKEPGYSRQEKWPREYAADIAKLKTRDERIKAFGFVPEKFKGMVRVHLNAIKRNIRK